MKKEIIACFLMLGVFVSMNAQGRKDIVRNEVRTQTVYEYFLDEGQKDPVIERIQVYDSLGNVIEEKEYNREGQIKVWTKYKFDANGDVLVEENLDVKGKVIERVEMDYKNGLIREKRYYDKKGREVKKKEYKYEFN